MSSQQTERFLAANQNLWDVRTDIHIDSQFYDLPAFKAGKSSLMPTEQELLGDVSGKSLLHLQCHFGQDSLSWARKGAQVTGVDFSTKAVETARQLASELDIDARFIQSDVLALSEQLDERFDIVFTSYGTIGWLPDLNAWAQVIANHLKPGGVFCFVEFHPYYSQMNGKGEITYDYFSSPKPDEEVSDQTYTDGPKHAELTSYWWNHTLSEVVMALQAAGLKISFFKEYPYSHYKLSDEMEEIGERQFVLKGLGKKVPYTYAILAKHVES